MYDVVHYLTLEGVLAVKSWEVLLVGAMNLEAVSETSWVACPSGADLDEIL